MPVTPAGGPRPAVSTVAAVDRALDLLGLLRRTGDVSVSEAAHHLGCAPSTAHRLLTTLVLRGFAVQDHRRRYRPGPQLTGVPEPLPGRTRLAQLALPVLEAARDTLGETVHLMVLQGTEIEFVEGAESRTQLRVVAHRGERLPAFTSAGGKAMLARLSNPELDRLYADGLVSWPGARVSTRQGLRRMMARVRGEGYAVNIEETERGVSGVGVAVLDAADRPLAAVTSATPSVRFARTDLPAHVQVLTDAAAELSALLSSPPPSSPHS